MLLRLLPALLAAQAAATAATATCDGQSKDLPSDQCKAWIVFWDSTGGANWTDCSGTRTDPCSCGSPHGYVECNSRGTTITRM